MPGKASSRGRDAVQAATTAARAAAAAIAAENIARMPAQEIDTAVDKDTIALIQDNTPVLELKGICAIGTGLDEPIRSYKLLLLPSGQAVRAPYCPGHFVVSTDSWTDITFPCWVMFEDSLKRKDELAVAVLDYFRVNPDLELMSIESLQQPIRVRNQVYRSHKECRIISIDRIKGFRAINAAAIEEGGVVGPWAEQYGPYKELNIKGRVGVWDFCDEPVRSRLPQLVELARAEAARVHAEDEIQDKQLADTTYNNLKLGHINKLAERLAAMNLSSYDQKIEERIRIFDAESTEQLRTPERGSMTAGTARIVTTRFVDVMISLDEAAEQSAAPAAASGDEFRDIEEVDAEVEEGAASAPPAPAAAPAAAASINNSQPPTAKPMRRRQQPKKTERYQPEPLEKPDDGRKKASAGQQVPPGDGSSAAEVLLNCDGVPYKRGGPHRERATKASGSAAGASGAAAQPFRRAGKQKLIDITATDTDSTASRDRIASLESALDAIRAENHNLERQKLSLEMQLRSQAENVELRIDAVKAKVGAEYQNMLHQQFMSGLATGSAMASQGAMYVPGVQPFSFGGGPACPSARSASLGSSMPGSGMGTQ